MNLPQKLGSGQNIFKDGVRVINGIIDYLNSPWLSVGNGLKITQMQNQIGISMPQKAGSGGGGSSEYQGPFKIIDVSDEDGFKISVIDSTTGGASSFTYQYVYVIENHVSQGAGGITSLLLENYAISEGSLVAYVLVPVSGITSIKIDTSVQFMADRVLTFTSSITELKYSHLIGTVQFLNGTMIITQAQFGAISAFITGGKA